MEEDRNEVAGKQKKPPERCTPHWKIFYISASDSANSEPERRQKASGSGWENLVLQERKNLIVCNHIIILHGV